MVGLPLAGLHPLLALHCPITQSGLGIPHPQQEAAPHHLQAMLPTVEEVAPDELERFPSCRGALEALAFVNRITDTDLRTASADTSPHRRGKKMGESYVSAVPPDLPKTCEPEITWRWQMKVQMTWYTVTPTTYLQQCAY